MTTALAAALVSCLPVAQETIGGKPYRKLATREATSRSMRAELSGADIEWGSWRWLGPFALPGGSKEIAHPFAPEHELASKGRVDATSWRELTDLQSQGTIDLRKLVPDPRVAVYLHRKLVALRPSKARVNVGSDDGLRLWLDGELLVDAPVERGFEPEQHVLELELSAGEHELLAKVAQDEGGYAFALAPDVEFDRAFETELDWRLQKDFPEGESAHYRIASLALPESAVLEVGGIDLLADGRPIVCTRRGDVFVVEDAYGVPGSGSPPSLSLFASGLHEPLGVAVRPDARARGGWCVLLAQRGELTRLVDLDGDLRADLHETACDAWQVSGNYHEYAFGPRYDADGAAWVTLNLAHADGPTVMGALVPTRGCAVRIAPDGRLDVMADGLRSPDGIGWIEGLGAVYTDNQGDYVATNKLSLLLPGSFHGHQSSLPMRAREPLAFACPPWNPGDPPPARQPPAIWFPYGKMGQSASDVVADDTGGKFGPFAGQLFVGDQTQASVMRVFLERVRTDDGELVQGACFPFRSGFKSGVHRLRFAPDGSLFAGLTDRGWASRGGWRDGLERVVFTGETPFELLAVRAASDGFELELTQDVNPATAADPASFQVTSWTYEYHPEYGCDEMEVAPQRVTAVRIVSPRRIHLSIASPRAGFVHEIAAAGLRSAADLGLLHPTAWYTLNRIPQERAPER